MTVRTLMERDMKAEGLTTERRQTLPEYIKMLRVSNHYRQSYVASCLNISRQAYSHYETGRIRPPVRVLYGIASLYGIPMDNLLSRMVSGGCETENRTRDGNRPENEKNLKMSSLKEEGNSNAEILFLSYFRNLTGKEQEDILSIMKLKIKDKSFADGIKQEYKNQS